MQEERIIPQSLVGPTKCRHRATKPNVPETTPPTLAHQWVHSFPTIQSSLFSLFFFFSSNRIDRCSTANTTNQPNRPLFSLLPFSHFTPHYTQHQQQQQQHPLRHPLFDATQNFISCNWRTHQHVELVGSGSIIPQMDRDNAPAKRITENPPKVNPMNLAGS